MAIQIKFCGAAGTVTGSCYWVRTHNCQFLIDCGMFQGSKTIKALNYEPFPFDPREIDFLLLTHAHIDHAGLLPKLVKHGFSGPIYATDGTRDLLSFMLPDSAYIQEMEVDRLNRRNMQRGKPKVEPTYTRKHVNQCLTQFRPVEYETWVDLELVRIQFWNAGHILGAASIEVEVPDNSSESGPLKLLFSGDLGPDHKAFHPDPDAPNGYDYLICESTYGGRERTDASPKERRSLLAGEINAAMEAGGNLIIPAFAVERTQELLLDLSYLLKSGDIPSVPVFLDSPLAIKVTSVFSAHAGKLEDIEGKPAAFNHPSFHFTETADMSKAIARFSSGAIILAASGMCDAGRIRHHLKNHLWRSQSTILLVGYQAEGTLGRMLEQGKKRVKIQGDEIEVRARIRTLDTYSGHADGSGLVKWIEERMPLKHQLFLTHGSEGAINALQKDLIAGGIPAGQIITPKLDDEYELSAAGSRRVHKEAVRRVDPAMIDKPDWHNDLAQLTLDIRSRLDHAASDKERTEMLLKLKHAFDNSKRNKKRRPH